MRGRNNNRKGPNPLTRNYESNGPDVKIRGSAQQVADKYAALARDAQSAGDRVMAENYLQHAEHYNRIIAAATAQAQAQRESREEREDRDDSSEEDTSARRTSARESSSVREPGSDGTGPQPVIEGTPAEVAFGDKQSQPETRRGRGRKGGDGSEAPHQNAVSDSDESEAKDGAPAKRPSRRPRRPVISAESAEVGGSPEDETSNDNPLTAAAGE